jgi:hypothetical protein
MPRTLEPQYPRWLQDFFTLGTMPGSEYELPDIYQGLPTGYGDSEGDDYYDITPGAYYTEWGLTDTPEEGLGTISSYPEHEERYSILDYMFGTEGVREDFESRGYALGDVYEGAQSNVSGGLNSGSRNRELMNTKRLISEGMADLEAQKAFGLHREESNFALGILDERRDYESQVLDDWINWLGNQPVEG